MRIVLNMIVRDESAIIERCLDSVRPLIDDMVILDTGSVDSTMDVIGRWAGRNQIGLHMRKRPWRGFGRSRTEALEYAREKFPDEPDTMVLFIDADEVLEIGDIGNTPDAELILFTVHNRDLVYQRNAMAKLHHPFEWRGTVHEVLTSDTPHRRASMPGLTIKVSHDGARSRDPRKFLKDSAALMHDYAKNPRDPRTVFYLAQSLRDGNEPELARVLYKLRASMTGSFEEERWYAVYQQALTHDVASPDRKRLLLRAHDQRPSRAEPLIALAEMSEPGEAMMYLQRAAGLPFPQDILFVNRACYRGGWNLTHLALRNAYYTKRDDDFLLARSLIADNYPGAPASILKYLNDNAEFYRDPHADTDI